jgi:hypothetical protein
MLARVEQLMPEHIDGFERWLNEGRHTEIVSYQTVAKLIACLRLVHQDQQGAISPRTLARLRYVGIHYYSPGKPRDAYSDRIASALREAARQDVLAAHRRIAVQGAAVQRDGPAEGSAELRAAYRMVMARIDEDGTIGFERPVYKYLYWLRHEEGLDTAGLIDELHGHLYLNVNDVVAFLVLLSLDTGLEIECCKGLTVACLKNAAGGYVDIEYCKRRARGAEWKRLRVRDGGGTTPGGLVRLALRLGERARARLATDSLWAYFCTGRLVAGVGHPSTEVLAAFAARHGITDDDGRPLNLVLARLRKTQRSQWYRRTEGQLERFAVGHSREVAANHYADIPALRALHEAAVADGLTDALDAALAPRLVMPDEEARMRAAPTTADPDVPPAEVAAFPDGAQDLWLASCSAFYASPFGRTGEACPVPFWGCLECKNAVITATKLPALIAFMDFMVAQREALSSADWAAKFGRVHARIAEQILPAFPEAEIAAARCVAASQSDLIHLPPEAGAA